MHHEGLDPVLVFALIGVLGVGSQWLAWRFRLPAIVLMLVAGLVAGPATGILNPARDIGDLMRPMVAIAVAIILFEGGLTLNLKSLTGASLPVRRLVFVGAPLGWLLSTLAGHYAGGLSWESAVVFGGILVVTGPTVIAPLLRQAALASRPASILKWEAIVNDPVGALAAVLAFEVVSALNTQGSLLAAAEHLAIGIVVATVAGFAAGWAIVWTFQRGHVPEYMKVPVLFGAVLAVYAGSDTLLHESGLLAVTVMGLYIANSHLPSFTEILRFKEHATVLLVSGVFILLASSLTLDMLMLLDWRALAFVLAIVFVARPLTVLLSFVGTDLPRNERILVAWIGPRGVVLVAVAGLFGTRLEELGIADGPLLAPLSFALVAATVVLHGFSIAPLGRALGLGAKTAPGLLIAGGSKWTVALAETLKEADVPVLIADRNWFRLRSARQAEIPVFFGEVLSEAAEHSLDPNAYAFVLAATDNDAYNTLICTDLGPEFGRNQVFQVGRHEGQENDRDLPVTLGGRGFAAGWPVEEYADRLAEGWRFRVTGLTEAFGPDAYREANPDALILGAIDKAGGLRFADPKTEFALKGDDRVLGFGPPD